MAGFLLSILEGTLGLTSDEKAAIEPCLPFAKDMIDRVNTAWPSVLAGNNVIANNPALILRLLNDIKVLLPNASALLGDGYVDCGAALSSIKDLQTACNANKATVSQVIDIYNALEPVIVNISAEWPKVEPAYNAVVAAAKRKGYDLGAFLGRMHQSFVSTAKPNPTPPPPAAALKPESAELNITGPKVSPPNLKS